MPPKAAATPASNTTAARRSIEAASEEAIKRVPPAVGNIIKMATPHVITAVDLADKASPYINKAYDIGCDVYKKLEPYHPEQWVPMIVGLVMCFFGGSYLMLIAAFEAFRLSGYSRVKKATDILYMNAQAALKASREDDKVDADNDGVADVLQISNSELLTRKCMVVLKAVEPEKVSEALTGLWAGFLAVVATLRVNFAQAVTLGAAIGETLEKKAGPTVTKTVEDALPEEFKKWSPTVVDYVFKAFGVSIAWFLQRVISAFHSAMRGGQMFASCLATYLKTHRDIDLSANVVNGLALAASVMGFLWQLNHGFSVPFPLNLLLLPVTIAEWILVTVVSMF
eukprot:PhM_4_TR7747/c0_g1_i1/m.49918